MNNSRHYEYYKFKYIEQASNMQKDTLIYIENAANREDIDVEILFGIISLESLNRGDYFTQILEKLGSLLAPSYLIKKDVSLGIGQVKISTAKKVLENRNSKETLTSLLNTQENIKIVAKLLSEYIKKMVNEEDVLRYIVHKYTTGKVNPKPSKEIELYYLLLKWSVKKRIFKQTIARYNEDIKNTVVFKR